jgi:hypothetical protein
MKLASAGGIEILIEAMKETSSEVACEALESINFVVADNKHKTAAFGGTEVIIQARENHSSNESVLKKSMRCFHEHQPL